MEISTIFALFVGTMITIHFLDLLAKRIGSRRKRKETNTKRASWYCFFSPDIFAGKDKIDKSLIRDNQQDAVRRNRQRREQERRRPVLRA